MEFRILGPLQATAGPAEATLARRERILLALLLLHTNQPVSVERIIEAIWGQRQPRNATGQVHSTVYRLRKQLAMAGIPEAAILTDPAGYRTQIDPQTLDLIRFRQLRDRARTTAAGGEPEQAAAQYRAGLELLRGSALAGIDSDLLRQAAATLDEEHLQAWQECLETELSMGHAGELVAELTDLVGQHPHREGLHRLLMLALYRADRQADALAAYRHARQLLRDDLGIEPGAELQRLHQAILNRDPDLNADRRQPKPAPTTTATSPIPRELPADVPGFTGRADALKALDEMLAAVSHEAPAPVVISAIAGTAGVGKTALAVHWAHRVAEQFPDGQLYLNLRGYASETPVRPIEALSALLRSLGTPPEQIPTDEAQAAALYRTKLADQRILVLLDNARSVDQVRPLLPGAPGCVVLITSRDRLTGLVARDGAHRITLDVLTPVEAGTLLARLLDRERVQAEPEATAELAHICAYLPLALRVAAAHLAGHPNRSIATHASELTAGDRLATFQVNGDDESTLRIALDLSYKSMSTETQRTFRLLGIVPGPDFSPEAAAALAGISLPRAIRHLHKLKDAHLIDELQSGRYSFHDLLRLYARQLVGHECRTDHSIAPLRRLLAFYLRTADSADSVLFPEMLRLPLPPLEEGIPVIRFDQHDSALTWLAQEQANMVAAILHAAEHEPRPMSWMLADRLRGYFVRFRNTIDYLAVAEATLAAASKEGDLQAQAAGHLGLGGAYYSAARFPEAMEHYAAAVGLARRAGWLDGQAAALGNLGTVHRSLGHTAQAAEYIAQSLDLNRRNHRLGAQAVNSGNLAQIYDELGRLREAVQQLDKTLQLYRQVAAARGEAVTLLGLGSVHHQLGRLDQAHTFAVHALSLFREIADRDGEIDSLGLLGELLGDAGRLGDALSHALEGVTLANKMTDPLSLVIALNSTGFVKLHLGLFEEATGFCRRALELARETGYRPAEAKALLCLAAAGTQLDELELAHRAARQAYDLACEAGYQVVTGRALTHLAEVSFKQGRYTRARGYVNDALRNHRETGHRLGEARSLTICGHIAQASGEPVVARQIWREAVMLFDDIGAPVPENLRVALEAVSTTEGGRAMGFGPAGSD